MRPHRILAMAAMLALGATLFAATGASAVDSTSGDFTYTTDGNNATITGYSGNGGNVTIPDTIVDGDITYPVTTIGTQAFQSKNLSFVGIPSTVTSIASRAFGWNSITSVTLPSSLTTIGELAFSSNQLTTVVIPSGVTAIPANAFSSNSLVSVSIPNTVASIGDSAFYGNALTTLTIPSSVVTIGNNAFSANSLESLTIPSGVTSIGASAFSFNQLTSVTIGADVARLGDRAFGSNPNLVSALFLGDAPTVTSAGNSGSFDTSNSAFAIAIPSGNTTFGTEATWLGYPLAPQTIVAPVGGSRSATLDAATFASVPFSHSSRDVMAYPILSVQDLTGAHVGWAVTLVASTLTWSATTGGPSTGADIPASALTLTSVGDVTTTPGSQDWTGTPGSGPLNSPVTVLSTTEGNGSYTAPLTLTLTIPGQASVGSYTGTLTTTISAAP